MRNGICLCLCVGLLALATASHASSPDEWERHNREVTAACIRASGLKQASRVGDGILFGDDIGLDAVLIRGRLPQPHMKDAEGHVLCLFNRNTRQAHCSEASQWFSPDGQ